MSSGWFVFDQAPGALVLTDRNLVVIRANAAFAALVGLSPAEVVGQDGHEVLRLGTREAAEKRLGALRVDGPRYVVDQHVERHGGHDVWLRVNVGAAEDGTGRRFFVAQVDDTTGHHRTTQRLLRLAERDHLTGLLNRRRVEEELEAVLASVRRHDREAALVLIDLDHFKAVNDREGHEAGDRVLSFVAAVLATRVRGDEFAVLLRDVTPEGAEAVAGELAALVAGAGYTRGRGVTLSVGVAALTAETRSAQDALHATSRCTPPRPPAATASRRGEATAAPHGTGARSARRRSDRVQGSSRVEPAEVTRIAGHDARGIVFAGAEEPRGHRPLRRFPCAPAGRRTPWPQACESHDEGVGTAHLVGAAASSGRISRADLSKS